MTATVFRAPLCCSGEAGIGKTTLWLAGLDAAAARGYRILSARPAEAEATFSFAGLTDLLGNAADEVLSELPPIQQRALEAALLLGESEIHADDRAVAAAFLGALRLLARDSPAVPRGRRRSVAGRGVARDASATRLPGSTVSRSPPCWRSAANRRRGFAAPCPRTG